MKNFVKNIKFICVLIIIIIIDVFAVPWGIVQPLVVKFPHTMTYCVCEPPSPILMSPRYDDATTAPAPRVAAIVGARVDIIVAAGVPATIPAAPNPRHPANSAGPTATAAASNPMLPARIAIAGPKAPSARAPLLAYVTMQLIVRIIWSVHSLGCDFCTAPKHNH